MSENINQIQVSKWFPAREIIKRSWSFYKTNFKKLWPLFVLGSLSFNFTSGGDSKSTIKDSVPIEYLNSYVVVSIVILAVLISIFLVLSKIALFKALADFDKNQFVGIKDSYLKSKKLFWGYILITIIVALSCAGGYLLLIIPGIIVQIYLSFTMFEYIAADKKSFSAATSSWSMVKGRWLKVFAGSLSLAVYMIIIIIAIALASVIASALIGYIVSLIFKVAMFNALVFTWFAIMGLVFVFAILPLFNIVFFEFYKEVKKEPLFGDAGPEVEKNRKNRLMTLMVLGVIAIVAIIFFAFFLDGKVKESEQKAKIAHDKAIIASLKVKDILLEDEGKLIEKGDVKTYKSSVGKYSVELPKNWLVDESVSSTTLGIDHLAGFVSIDNNDTVNSVIRIESRVNSDVKKDTKDEEILGYSFDSLKEYYTSGYKSDSEIAKMDLLKFEKSTLNGVPVIESIISETDRSYSQSTRRIVSTDFKTYLIIAVKNGVFYSITYSPNEIKNYDKYYSEARKVIESIKFN